jgi:hypothetical protein
VLVRIVATVRTASIDGYRRGPYTPIARRVDPTRRSARATT